MRRVLVAGCGYVGGRLAELLLDEGVAVWGLRREPEGLPEGVTPAAADVGDPATLRDLPSTLDAVVYAVAPAGRSETAYRTAYVEGVRNVMQAAGASTPTGTFEGRFVLVTSTGVYGYTDGRRVDEETPPEPTDATGQVLLEGEAVVRRRGESGSSQGTGSTGSRDEDRPLEDPGIVLRLGGIYGPGRTRTIRRVLEGEARCPPPDRYGNRIHRDDAARALLHLLHLPDPDPVYLGVDRDPAPLRDVYRWLAERAGAPDPCRDEEAETWEARGRRGTNKRCSSDRLAASGFEFLYPTFREGYGALLESES